MHICFSIARQNIISLDESIVACVQQFICDWGPILDFFLGVIKSRHAVMILSDAKGKIKMKPCLGIVQINTLLPSWIDIEDPQNVTTALFFSDDRFFLTQLFYKSNQETLSTSPKLFALRILHLHGTPRHYYSDNHEYSLWTHHLPRPHCGGACAPPPAAAPVDWGKGRK